MTDLFETLVSQLGHTLNVKLHVDRNHACAIKIHHRLIVQLQIDAAQENLLIAAFIAEIPPGKFCENVLSEALKSNHLPDPRTGILGFIARTNRLTMHQRYLVSALDGEKLALYVAGFIDYAELWQKSIESGQASPSPVLNQKTRSPFNL
jgi:hypothetical protein